MARRVYIPRGKREQIPEIGAEVAFRIKRDECSCSIAQLVPSEVNPLAWPWPDEMIYKAIIPCRAGHADHFERYMMVVLGALSESDLPEGSDITDILENAINFYEPP